jgi:hypothetical protein
MLIVQPSTYLLGNCKATVNALCQNWLICELSCSLMAQVVIGSEWSGDMQLTEWSL